MEESAYFRVTDPEPHVGRTKEILKNHPEIRALFGHTPSTALWVASLVPLQFFLAVTLENAAGG